MGSSSQNLYQMFKIFLNAMLNTRNCFLCGIPNNQDANRYNIMNQARPTYPITFTDFFQSDTN